jgi:hypothetical protein
VKGRRIKEPMDEKGHDSDLCIFPWDDVEGVGGGVVHKAHIVIVSKGPQEQHVVGLTPLSRGEDACLGVLGRQITTEPSVGDEGAAQ